MKQKKVLFIGRFQPFHKGHLRTLKKIAKVEDVGEIVIGIGSSNITFTSYNPFTAQERKAMLEASLKLGVPFEIKLIPDISDNYEWTRALLEKYFDGEIVYSGNSLVIELLNKAGKEVRTPPPIHNPSGTEIRQLVANGKEWEPFVPVEVVRAIKKMNGEKRIKELFR